MKAEEFINEFGFHKPGYFRVGDIIAAKDRYGDQFTGQIEDISVRPSGKVRELEVARIKILSKNGEKIDYDLYTSMQTFPRDPDIKLINRDSRSQQGMAENKGIAESLNQPYNLIDWYQEDFGEPLKTWAALPDGTNLEINFNKESPLYNDWDVDFYRGGTIKKTGQGDQQRIFATVLLAIQQFINNQQPNEIRFSALKHEDETGSRRKLYTALAKKYAAGLGYALSTKDDDYHQHYVFKKIQQGVRESTEQTMSIKDTLAYLQKVMGTESHEDWRNDIINNNDYFVLKDIPLNSLWIDLPMLDKSNIEKYKQMDFSKAPPIVIGSNGNIIDGYHRANVAKALNIPTLKAWVGVKKQGVAEDYLNEHRKGLYNFVKNKFPTWPEYVLKDFLYQQARTITSQEQLNDWLEMTKKDFGKVTWKLEKLPITLDIFTPKTQRMIKQREGGSSNPFQVPRDAERHAQQLKMIQQQGVRTEPIIVAKLNNGYDLIEGWHRTIQHLQQFPEGYTGPAWVAYGATYTSESKQGVAESIGDDDVDQITNDFIKHYPDDPLSVFMQAKASYLYAVERAKDFSNKAYDLYRSHGNMSREEFQNTVMKYFGKHLRNNGFPRHASKAWGEAEHQLRDELMNSDQTVVIK